MYIYLLKKKKNKKQVKKKKVAERGGIPISPTPRPEWTPI